jgi:hypothetical protein
MLATPAVVVAVVVLGFNPAHRTLRVQDFLDFLQI